MNTKKKWGQHFLHDTRIIARIVGNAPGDCRGIVEVGPGTGALTAPLCRLGKPVVAVEKDPRFASLLEELRPAPALLIGDALEVDYPALFREHFPQEGGAVWLVSNLPYNVSAPLLMTFFPLEGVGAMTLMMQREVAAKLHPSPENLNRASSLWALGQTYFSITKVAAVPPGAFKPPPQVESAVLGFRRRPDPKVPLESFRPFERFNRTLFAHKRKQLLPILGAAYGTAPVARVFGELGLPPTLRAERLSLQQIQILFKHLGRGNHGY